MICRRHVPTFFKSVDSTTESELIGSEDTDKNREQTAAKPPSNGVSKEVDLLSGVVLCPEADTTKQEGPLEWLTGVRMAARQGIVMVEHGSLEFEVLLQETHWLDLAGFLVASRAVWSQRGDIFRIPEVAWLLGVLVSVDFSLLVSPVWQRIGMSPHGNL